MASSSSHSTHRWTYDVFVSFRGEDIREGFMDHLFSDFQRKEISAFRDDDHLPKGEEISPQLDKAIEESRFLVVIFSKNYASSTWCLRELVKILECKKMEKQKYEVRIIFYDVKPAVVRHQTDTYKEAFEKHEGSKKTDVAIWRDAVTKAADILGWDFQDAANRDESKFIDKISKDIFYKLIDGPIYVGENLVGIDKRLKQMNLLKFVGSSEVCMIWIWGFSGVGKTTIAKAIYNKLCVYFDGYIFCEDVKGFMKKNSLVQLQKQLIDAISKVEDAKIQSVAQGINMMKKMAVSKQILIVLDNVDHPYPLEVLASSPKWFGSGSLIIVTGDDRQVLKARGVDPIFAVELLCDDEALELFSRYAFKDKHPKKNFRKLADQVVKYVNGHPGAAKSLGCFLFDKNVDEWESELNSLQKYPPDEINQAFRLSYDRLNRFQRSIFLDIACFFLGEKKDFVVKILERDFFAATNIKVLVDRALVTISEDMRLEMHELVKLMGWGIICEESKNPGERTRLWSQDDVCDVLTNDKGTEAVEGLVLDLKGRKVKVGIKAIERLKKLRILKICNALDFSEDSMPGSSVCLEYLSNELRWLYWHGYPFKLLPSTFYPAHLVVLDLSYSNVEHLWTGSMTQSLPNLKFIRLISCHNLVETPDFTEIPNLEEVILEGCSNLLKVHPSLEFLKKVPVLNLKNCSKIERSPKDFGNMEALQELRVGDTGITQLFSSLSTLRNLEVLPLTGLKEIEGMQKMNTFYQNCINFKHFTKIAVTLRVTEL